MSFQDHKGPFWVVNKSIQSKIYDPWPKAALQVTTYLGVPVRSFLRSLPLLTASPNTIYSNHRWPIIEVNSQMSQPEGITDDELTRLQKNSTPNSSLQPLRMY